MRKNRELVDEAFYHVTSRTNNKVRVFDSRLGGTIMLTVLEDAKKKFDFQLANFCIMPTHIHLLIKPGEGTDLSRIMHCIKIQSAKWWNIANGSSNHLWGDRFFSKIIKDQQEFCAVMEYIDQNPVKAGLASTPEDWKNSGAYYRKENISGLLD